jgi:hypothetical protein
VTVSRECWETAERLLHLYEISKELYLTIAQTPLLRATVEDLKAAAERVEYLVEFLYRDKQLLDEGTYHVLRSHLQDVTGRLPTRIDPEAPVGEIEASLEASRLAANRLTDRVANAMFQAVVECERKRG